MVITVMDEGQKEANRKWTPLAELDSDNLIIKIC